MDLKSWAYREFLENDEYIVKIHSKPFFRILILMILVIAFAGGIIYGLWFVLPEDLKPLVYIIGFLGFIKALAIFRSWYMDVLLITNLGITVIEWKEFFHKKSQRIEYHLLDDIEIEQDGVHEVLFNFGTIIFVSNGGGGFSMKNVNNPKKLQYDVEEARESFLSDKNFTEESALKDLLAQMVKTHVGTKGGAFHDYTETFQGRKTAKTTPRTTPKTERIIVEKELDDNGGISIDLDQK